MTITIRQDNTAKEIFVSEKATTVAEAVWEALEKGVSLQYANLIGADLRGRSLTGVNLLGANLYRANLGEVNLSSANLSETNCRSAELYKANLTDAKLESALLSFANLTEATLYKANLRDANLLNASLRDVNLKRANLSRADLDGAVLYEANLQGADLTDTRLSHVQSDFCDVLSYAPQEVPALLKALRAGKVNGTTYTDGVCGCLVGTLSMAAGTPPEQWEACDRVRGLVGNPSRPIESFFYSIRIGDTPENSHVARLAYEWAAAWYERVSAAFTPPTDTPDTGDK